MPATPPEATVPVTRRISGDPEDPAYSPIAFACRVRMNGDPAPGVITADPQEGWVLRYQMTPEGRPYIDTATGQPATEVVRGLVEVFAPEGWAAFPPEVVQ